MNIYFDAIRNAIEKGISSSDIECPVCKGKTLSVTPGNIITEEGKTKGQYEFNLECTNGCQYDDIYNAGGIYECVVGDLVLENAEHQKMDEAEQEYQDMKEHMSLYSLSELKDMDIQKPPFIVEGLLSIGVYLLGAEPKIGKSWLCLQLIDAVATGSDFLGFKTNKGKVLYLALEDSLFRIKERNIKQGNGWENRDVALYAKPLEKDGGGLIADLELYYQKNKDVRLIIIDVLEYIRSEQGRGEGVYSFDYRTMKPLKNFAMKHNLTILTVHHTNKNRITTNPFEKISGSNGLRGSVDGLIVLDRDCSDDKIVNLHAHGKDIETIDIAMQFTENCTWKNIGTVEEIEEYSATQAYMNNPIRQVLIKLITEDNPKLEGRVSTIIDKSKEIGSALNMSAQTIGLWLKNEMNIKRLKDFDNIRVTILDKGSASKWYKFQWEKSPVTEWDEE